jgi:hypothetical protein
MERRTIACGSGCPVIAGETVHHRTVTSGTEIVLDIPSISV